MNLTYCGRPFSAVEIERIRALAQTARSREALARTVCDEIDWRKPDGGLKTMSCKVVLLRMQRDGLLTLPTPRHRYGQPQRGRATASEIGLPVSGSRGDLPDLHLVPVATPAESRAWNTMMRQHHYLGYQPLPGAQIRYLIHGGGHLLGGLGFGAAAWKVAPRDNFIGWSPAQRQARLHLVVGNARFLLLPWVQVRFLASSVLAAAAHRLPLDWADRYNVRPVLLETFVERPRFAGTC
ncbi:MAG: Druantia anti-phage system protein DruA, partial [Solirubrobacteraceae bacterium]